MAHSCFLASDFLSNASYERPLDNLRDWSDREHGRRIEAAWELGVNARGPYVL